MGKLNDIQQQSTQSWGNNSFTTRIDSDKVVFDSQKDKFTFSDPVEVPSLTVNGKEITGDVPEVKYSSSVSGFAQKIGTLSVGETNYDVKIPLVNYSEWSGSEVALQSGKFTLCTGTQTSIVIVSGGSTNIVNYIYAIFTAGENFIMPSSGYSNLSTLTSGKRYFLTVIGDSIKGWNYFFQEMTDLSL